MKHAEASLPEQGSTFDGHYRSGMRLRVIGKPPEFGPHAAHAGTLERDSITDVETGLPVTDIRSLVIFLNAFGWMDAIVTVTERDEAGHVVFGENGEGVLFARYVSQVEPNLTVRSESVADHAERLRRMGETIKQADRLVKAVEEGLPNRDDIVLTYREARAGLNEVGGI